MRYSIALSGAALVASVSAGYGQGYGHGYGYQSEAPSYTTKVYTDRYTTYCSEPTHISHGGKTYTVSSATTLTITDCPCTVTHPVT